MSHVYATLPLLFAKRLFLTLKTPDIPVTKEQPFHCAKLALLYVASCEMINFMVHLVQLNKKQNKATNRHGNQFQVKGHQKKEIVNVIEAPSARYMWPQPRTWFMTK